jgi:hypothetical protein
MNEARVGHTATLLPTGEVLIAGGEDGTNMLRTAELYDPAAGTFTATGGMLVERRSHTATLLSNGQVLIVGGSDTTDGSSVLASAETYDPVAGTFAAVGSMATVRIFHTATLLQDGRVLIAGGYDSLGNWLSSTELYDPAVGTFSPTGSMTMARGRHTATLLPNGKALMAGGVPSTEAFQGTSSAELYDPMAETSTPTGNMTATRWGHTATLLPYGEVFITGGYRLAMTAELYDPAAGVFVATGAPSFPEAIQTATLLPSGNVLLAGGDVVHGVSGEVFCTADLYYPAAGAFAATANLVVVRAGGHTATLLPNGKVLIAGGYAETGTPRPSLASAELFTE